MYVVTGDRNLIVAVANHMQFQKVACEVMADEKLPDNVDFKEPTMLVVDMRGYQISHLRNAIMRLRERWNNIATPILVLCDMADSMERELVNDLEFFWFVTPNSTGEEFYRTFEKTNHLLTDRCDVLDLRQRVEEAIKLKKYDIALSLIDDLDKSYNNPFVIAMLRAKVNGEMGRYDESFAFLDQAFKEMPTSLSMRILASTIYRKCGRKDLLEKNVKEMLDLPSVKYLMSIAEKLIAEGNGPNDDNHKLKLYKGNDDVMHMNYGAGADTEKKSDESSSHQDVSRIFNLQGIVFNNQQQYAEAEKCFKISLMFLEDKTIAHKLWYNLAITKVKQRLYDDALSYVDMGLAACESPQLVDMKEKITQIIQQRKKPA
jgi:tetratricopeptide (TPR) repeat protein